MSTSAADVLRDLMRGPEYQVDPIVRAHVHAWGLGASAGDVLLGLVRALAGDRQRLMDEAIRLLREQPFGPIVLRPGADP